MIIFNVARTLPRRRRTLNFVQVRIVVDIGPESDESDLSDAALQLRTMLCHQPVEKVEPDKGAPPPTGAKAGELAAIGAIVVTLAPAAFDAVVATVNLWAQRQSGRSARVTIGGDTLELVGLTNAQAQQVIDRFWDATGTSRTEEIRNGHP